VNTPLAEEVSLSRNLCWCGWRLTTGSRPEVRPESDNLSRSKITKKNNTAVACMRAFAKRVRLKRVRLHLSAARTGLRWTARIAHARDGTGANRLVTDAPHGARGPAFTPGINARVPCGSL
jgi:hypothetical protein